MAKQFFREYKIIHRCYKCGKRLEARWDFNYTSGDYHVGDFVWSEVLDAPVPYHDQIICNECFDKLNILQKFAIKVKGNS